MRHIFSSCHAQGTYGAHTAWAARRVDRSIIDELDLFAIVFVVRRGSSNDCSKCSSICSNNNSSRCTVTKAAQICTAYFQVAHLNQHSCLPGFVASFSFLFLSLSRLCLFFCPPGFVYSLTALLLHSHSVCACMCEELQQLKCKLQDAFYCFLFMYVARKYAMQPCTPWARKRQEQQQNNCRHSHFSFHFEKKTSKKLKNCFFFLRMTHTHSHTHSHTQM